MRFVNAIQVFPKSSLLGQVNRRALFELDQVWTVSEFKKGQTIMSAEEQKSDVCFLLAGSARVAVFTENGREVSFLRLTKGDCFGEFSAIDGAPRSASIEALTTCVAARMTSEQFRSVLSVSPELSLALLETLVGKLRDLTNKVSDFNNLNADERIRAELLRLAETSHKGKDQFVIDNPPTQLEIAARVFSNRETVAREMGKMRRMGLLGRDGRRLCIPSLRMLQRYVENEASAHMKAAS